MSSFLDSTGLSHLIEKIKSAFVSKADTTPATTISIDSTPTANSTNLVTSGGVYSALDDKADDSDVVHTSGNETIFGVKTISAVGKLQVDDWNNIYNWDDDETLGAVLGSKERTSNKVTSISSSSTDTQYPSAKCVYDNVNSAFSKIPYGVVDSTSTSTVFTATVPGITALEDGTCVMLRNSVVTSASGFTLNINGLGAHHAFNNMTLTTAETTIFNINYTMLFVYCADVTVSSIKGAWCCYRGYDANTNTIGYQVRTNSGIRTVTDTARYYKLYFTSADTQQWVPASVNSTNNVTTARTPNQRPIDPFGPIVYTSANTNYAAGANLAATTIWQQYAMNLGYSFGPLATSMTSNKPVYLKCAPQSNGSAIIDSTTPVVQTLPSTEDGKIYIFLGIAYSASNIELNISHPVYYYKDSAIRIWTNASVTIDSTPTQNSTNAVSSGGTYTELKKKIESSYIVSRGENLITNGFATLGNNFNFSTFTYDGTDTNGANGCFKYTTSGSTSIRIDEYLPIDITKTYRFKYSVKNSATARTYNFIELYDVDKNVISAGQSTFTAGTTTTLAQELKDGDTTVYLTDLSNWSMSDNHYLRGFIFWNYVNSRGYQYPVETYSRNWWENLWDNSSTAIDKTNNTITLREGWTHGTFPVGTSVSQSAPSGAFIYGTHASKDSGNEWIVRESEYGPKHFRNGAAFCRPGWIMNQTGNPSITTKFSSISFTEKAGIDDLSTAGGVSVTELEPEYYPLTNGIIVSHYASSGYINIDGDIDFKTTDPILYYDSTCSLAFKERKNVVFSSGTGNGETWYIKCSPNNDEEYYKYYSFEGWVKGADLPRTADGFVYIPVGNSNSSGHLDFVSSEKTYMYFEGKFQEVSNVPILSYRESTGNAIELYEGEIVDCGTISNPEFDLIVGGNDIGEYRVFFTCGLSGMSLTFNDVIVNWKEIPQMILDNVYEINILRVDNKFYGIIIMYE